PDFLNAARSAAMRWLVRCAAELLALPLDLRRSGAEARARGAVAVSVFFWVLLRDISTPVVVGLAGHGRAGGGPAEGGHGQRGGAPWLVAARWRRRGGTAGPGRCRPGRALRPWRVLSQTAH